MRMVATNAGAPGELIRSRLRFVHIRSLNHNPTPRKTAK
jgi:hypothetical protein